MAVDEGDFSHVVWFESIALKLVNLHQLIVFAVS